MVISYLVDGGGGALPSMADLPAVETDAAMLLEHAELLATAGGQLQTRTEGAGSSWDDLSAVYTASGTEPLYSQFQPIVTRGDAMATALTRAGDALGEFALAVGGLTLDRDELASRITALRGQHDESEPDSVERMLVMGQATELRLDISAFAGRVELAEQTCVDALAAISGGTTSGVTRTAAAGPGGTAYLTTFDAAVSASVGDQLERLAAMTPDEAAAWLAEHPELADALATSPPPAADVSAWWASLGDPVVGADGTPDPNALQLALITAMPTVIGNLNGVPYWGRSDANVMALDIEIAEAEDAVAAAEEDGEWIVQGEYIVPNTQLSEARGLLEQLQGIQDAMDRDGLHQLTEFHPGQPPLAAVAAGDVDTATHLGVVVPGINTTTSSMNGLVGQAEVLQEAQMALDPDASPVVIAWVGYETPTTTTVWENSYAEAGGDNLGVTLDGLDAVNGGAYTTVYAHSYGSTTAVEALQDDGHGVDALAMYGSAGLTVDSVDGIQLPAEDVWAGEAPDDVIADIGRGGGSGHPHDPTSPDFGAQTYAVQESGGPFWNAHDQAQYFEDESLDNLAAIGMDRADQVTAPPDPYPDPQPGPSPTPPPAP